MQMHGLLRKIERAGMDPKTNKGGKPIAAALPGTAAGIGLELPLATHRIFVADNPKAQDRPAGNQVGIFPGAGGTTRMVAQARRDGGVALSAGGQDGRPAMRQNPLASSTRSWPIRSLRRRNGCCNAKDADLVKPWDAKGYKMPGGAPYHPAGFMTFVGAYAMVNGKTQGRLPRGQGAAERRLRRRAGAVRYRAEDRGALVHQRPDEPVIQRHDPQSLFLNKEALEKGPCVPKASPISASRRLGVLGAGMMGAGITLVSAQAGIEVVLIDQTQEAADKGKAYYRQLTWTRASPARSRPRRRRPPCLDLITATTDL